MSRAKRRAGQRGTRRRRTGVRAAAGRGLRSPWVPLVAVVGIVAVVALVAYLIWQQRQPASRRFAEAAGIEANRAPDLPGEYVNLPEIYGASYPNTASRVTRDVDYSDQGLPPAGGPHWGRGTCPTDEAGNPDPTPFCGPAPWGVYKKPWDPETLVQNLEYGGVVVWYNTTDQSVIDELESLVEDGLKDGRHLVMTPFPDMEEEYIALTAWARRDKFPVSEYNKDRVQEFIDAFERRFNPQGV